MESVFPTWVGLQEFGKKIFVMGVKCSNIVLMVGECPIFGDVLEDDFCQLWEAKGEG